MNKKIILFIVLAVVFIALAISTTFFYAAPCADLECFQNAMRKCSKAKYINEEPEATWRYEILGLEENQCRIEVTLLQPKAGELGIEKLIGNKMICDFPEGLAAYPEKDLERCHGRLKEELQTMVINRLHRYLIENLGEVGEGLNALS